MEHTTKDFTILLVDDTPDNIDILNAALGEYKRLVALNGKKAIQLASDKLPDLILLDIMMPEMDGYEVCAQLKSQDITKDIPIIFITSITESESIVKGFEVGAVDYVTKPFNISELKARVKTQLQLKQANDDINNYVNDIETKNRLITDSINYALRLQQASLPDLEYVDSIISDYFIIYKPKDIVSGDFYWIKEVDNKIIVIIADCTGHGVPGAFMSMFGIAFLNEIVNRNMQSKPSGILNELRDMVMTSLKQNLEGGVQDGMDISIISYDRASRTMEFAGAKNHLYMIRDQEVHKVKADSMPVSIYPYMKPFTNNEIELQSGDVVYLFTDGYADQFGGERNKKFGRKAFSNLMIENHNKPMKEQQEQFEKTFTDWKKDNEQVDDVLLFGIKVN